jgi:hypothetical protein
VVGYYIRVLTPSADCASFAALAKAAGSVEIERNGDESDWTEIRFGESAVVERNLVEPGSLGAAEIEEFLEALEGARPERGARWVRDYLATVKTVYAIQILGDYSDLIGDLKTAVWHDVGGIFQADLEGFSNEEGYAVVWQFSDGVEGPWHMAVLDEHDKWIEFEMDLGNREHRAAFLRGEVPR